MEDRILEVSNVSFAYENEHVLGNINMTANKGDFICVLGESGCGKSTLLRLLACLGKPSSGTILLNNQVHDKPKIDIGVVFQDYSLFPWLKTGENQLLALSQKYKEVPVNQLKKKVYEKVKEIHIARYPYNDFLFQNYDEEINE